MQVQPYLFFDGRCDEALEFYKKTIGADVKMVMRWKDSPDKSMCTPGNADKVMHAQFQVGETTIMTSDGRNTGHPKFDGFALSIASNMPCEAAAPSLCSSFFRRTVTAGPANFVLNTGRISCDMYARCP